MAVFVKDVSFYLRFQSSPMSNLLVHPVIQRRCLTRFDFAFQSQCGWFRRYSGSFGWKNPCSKPRLAACQDWAFLGKAQLKTQGHAHSNTLSLSQGPSFWIIWIPWTSSWRVLTRPVWLLGSCWSAHFLRLWRLKPSQLRGVFSGIYQACGSK